MKWSDLTLKERKQIYDSVRADNPDASYLDIKSQFDSIPAFQDGGKKDNPPLPKELGYDKGTPEYYRRQQQISGRADVIQPESYITPAGYIKDAINFAEDLGNGDYAGAALDATLNLIPWGVGKSIKKLKSKVGRLIEGTEGYNAQSYAEPFTPTITKKGKKGKKVKTEEDYDAEFSEVMRKHRNIQNYEKELSAITNGFFHLDDGLEVLERIDKAYGTDYRKAASKIAYQDMAGRGKYIKHQQMSDKHGNPIYGKTHGITESPSIDDMTVYLNPDYYLEGTANHELSHVADALVNKSHSANTSNNYMEYLLDPDNIMSYSELKQGLTNINPNTYNYLTTPAENKAHMIQLKRGMQKEGLINKWSDNITQDKIEEYLSYQNKNANKVNPVLRTLYDIRADKQGFVNRMNNLTPIEWAMPIGLSGLLGTSIYTDNKQTH